MPAAGHNSLDGSAEPPAKRHLLLLRRPQPSPSLGRRVTSEAGGEDGESGEEGVGETMPQVYDTHYFSLAHLFGFKARSESANPILVLFLSIYLAVIRNHPVLVIE